MDRQIVYPGQIPLETDLLNTNRYAMIAIAKLAAAMLGTATVVNGLACVPTGPASLQVVVNPGEVYSLANVDATGYSSLPADTAHSILKQGISLDAVTLSCPAPATSGQSVNYLIQVAYLDTDAGLVTLPYYNASNPTQAWAGPNNSGAQQATARRGVVSITVKTGIAAATGTQVTPAPDAGYTGLWVVSVANGQSTITAANITQAANAPILPADLLHAVQQNSLVTANDTGSANVYVVGYSPAITALVDGMVLWFKVKTANTGASTLNVNGLGAQPLVGGAHSALQGGELVANGKARAVWRADIASWVLLECSGGALQVAPATQSQHALQLTQLASLASQYVNTGGKLNGANNPNLSFNGSGEFGVAGWSLGSFSAVTDTSTGLGTFFTNTSALTSSTQSPSGPVVAVVNGVNITESIDVQTNISSGTLSLSLAAFNSSGAFISTIASLTLPNSSGLQRYSLSGVTPAGTATVAPYFNLVGVTCGALGIIFRRLKIEAGTQASLYSQEASIAGANTGRLLRTTVYTLIGGVQHVSVNGGAFTATGAGTFTALSGTNTLIYEVIGAGGGSGSTATTANVSVSGGGGGGGYTKGIATSGFASLVVAVGAGGAGGTAGGNGGNGGSSSVGALATALGGAGSSGNTTFTSGAGALLPGGAGALSGAGGNVITSQGGKGGFAWVTAAGQSLGGDGGAGGTGFPGGFGVGTGQVANPGVGPGAGAGGVCIINGSTVAGGSGAPGRIILQEFA